MPEDNEQKEKAAQLAAFQDHFKKLHDTFPQIGDLQKIVNAKHLTDDDQERWESFVQLIKASVVPGAQFGELLQQLQPIIERNKGKEREINGLPISTEAKDVRKAFKAFLNNSLGPLKSNLEFLADDKTSEKDREEIIEELKTHIKEFVD